MIAKNAVLTADVTVTAANAAIVLTVTMTVSVIAVGSAITMTFAVRFCSIVKEKLIWDALFGTLFPSRLG